MYFVFFVVFFAIYLFWGALHLRDSITLLYFFRNYRNNTSRVRLRFFAFVGCHSRSAASESYVVVIESGKINPINGEYAHVIKVHISPCEILWLLYLRLFVLGVFVAGALSN